MMLHEAWRAGAGWTKQEPFELEAFIAEINNNRRPKGKNCQIFMSYYLCGIWK